ncbi:helix-turn-helix domain-containing protein [Facklamia hominis]|uniref:HTH cro/C1-type domain-containing protein n=1 Tax=Facklamia hominis CCUG 36813 TaxID=883111 RepID=K1MGC7_9LACT|nr:helix-turn-helix transcriptional regulator [Facklamia hominis]EKB55089.1 hypothetical protein HMPREF9706_01279 [Facklamia hominis CCUG 36813]
MGFDYSNLWKILKERNILREELRIATGISSATLAKLGKNKIVSMSVLAKICHELNCDFGDIVSYVQEGEEC